ncbi:MAG: GGDEF domain-containing protein [Sulfuricella denitrificans]|nr:GGDEF domain-containing protein [Sulfuricella denitrificans]
MNPTDLARAALLKLTEKGLPPTPDNYSRFYNEIAGDPETPVPVENNNCGAVLNIIRDMLSEVTERTGGLASDIKDQNQSFKSSIDDLSLAQEKKHMLQLLGTILTTATSIHSSVEDAHLELAATKIALEQIKDDLQESRSQMQEDWLTGAQNRRAMDHVLGKEVVRAQRSAAKLSVAMLDVDHFKRVNDEFGHDAGDKLLQHLTLLTKAVLRESDSLVRYGGEEFLIILPETDIKGGEFVMGRLQQAFQKNPLQYENKQILVTFSAGLAALNPGENGHAMVMRADSALYQAKHAGRNCVKIAAD